jgi:hypothetical protein
VPSPMAASGRLRERGWASIALADGAELYLRRTTKWEVRAARRNGWQLEYPAWSGQFPSSVRLLSDSQTVNVDLTATITQVQANTDLDAAAFTVDVPPEAQPITLDDLRATGPLKGQ